MNQRHIVAIDIGTGNMALTVAKVEGDDLQVIYYKSSPSAGVKYGQIVNRQKASDALKNAVAEAETELGLKFTQAVVNYPKYNIRQTDTSMSFDRDPNEFVTSEELENMKNSATDSLDEKDMNDCIFNAVAQSFNAGSDIQISEKDIIGMALDTIECNLKLFIGPKTLVQNIESALDSIGVSVCRKYFTPETTANAVLFEPETDNGVALVDFGAGVTSVSIFEKNTLRYYGAIPFGGKSITADIKNECLISEKLAENIKLAYGGCKPDRMPDLGDKTLKITTNSALPPKLVTVKYLSEIVTARATEIVNAILYKIQESGFADRLRSGIVITGGGANLLNLSDLINELSGYSVRIGHPKKTFSAPEQNNIFFGTGASTSVGLVLAAKADKTVNCTEQSTGKSLFGNGGVVEETDSEPALILVGEDEPEREPDKKRKGGRKRKSTEPETTKETEEEGEKTTRGGLWGLFGRVYDGINEIKDDINNEDI